MACNIYYKVAISNWNTTLIFLLQGQYIFLKLNSVWIEKWCPGTLNTPFGVVVQFGLIDNLVNYCSFLSALRVFFGNHPILSVCSLEVLYGFDFGQYIASFDILIWTYTILVCPLDLNNGPYKYNG